jgi:hypothetical protein
MTGPNDDTEHAHSEETGETGETWDVALEDLNATPEFIEPGSPSLEHVAFVVLGVLLTLAVIYRLVTLVGATIA